MHFIRAPDPSAAWVGKNDGASVTIRIDQSKHIAGNRLRIEATAKCPNVTTWWRVRTFCFVFDQGVVC